jgi:uncharacterized coiled-coil protein SlyX
MSIGLFTALKAIPWGDVIAAAPVIVKGARNLFARRPEPAVPPGPADTGPQDPVAARIAALESRLAQAEQQQRLMAELAASLAEQNAKVVQAIDILRVRTRILLAASAVLGLSLIASVALSYSVFGAR